MVHNYEKLYFAGESGERECLIPVNVGMLKIEVKSGSLTAMAMLDRDSDYQPLSAISMKDYSHSLTMSGPGLFTLEVSGIYKIQFNYNGSDDVYMKSIC